MRKRDKLLLIEIVDEVLRKLPLDIPTFTKLPNYESVPNLRRKPRPDASGFKARRSTPNRKWESWVDVQTITLKEDDD